MVKISEIRTINSIFESPTMIDNFEFKLDNVQVNTEMVNNYLDKEIELFEDNKRYRFFRTGNDSQGNIVVISKTKIPTISYICNYILLKILKTLKM